MIIGEEPPANPLRAAGLTVSTDDPSVNGHAEAATGGDESLPPDEESSDWPADNHRVDKRRLHTYPYRATSSNS